MPTKSHPSHHVLRTLLGPILCLVEARQIVYQLTRKRIVLRYRGSFLGLLWTFILPGLTLAIYTLVFGVVLRSRWSPDESSTTQYALLLYLGLCVYWFVSDCLGEAPSLIRNHVNYVKKVVFPLEVLPWISVLDGLFQSAIRISVFLIAYFVFYGIPPWTLVLLPLVWLPICFWTLGISWVLAATGVFVRDLREIVGLILIGFMFLSPIFYSLDRVPESARFLLQLNPITLPVLQTRDVLYYGVIPDPALWSIITFASILFAWAGHALFMKSRGAFADVI